MNEFNTSAALQPIHSSLYWETEQEVRYHLHNFVFQSLEAVVAIQDLELR